MQQFQPTPTTQVAVTLHKPVFYTFLGTAILVWIFAIADLTLSPWMKWLDGMVFFMAAMTILVSLGRRFPIQYVAFTGVIMIVIAGAVEFYATKKGRPFGYAVYTEELGPRISGRLPWAVPFLWIGFVLGSRGLARLILRPWREHPEYGWWVIGLTAVLATALDACYEPFSAHVRHYRGWQTSPNSIHWYGVPWVNFVGWFGVSLALLLPVSPLLISKQPIRQPFDRHPAIVWLTLLAYFTTANAARGLWTAVELGVFLGAVAGFLAWRGSRVVLHD